MDQMGTSGENVSGSVAAFVTTGGQNINIIHGDYAKGFYAKETWVRPFEIVSRVLNYFYRGNHRSSRAIAPASATNILTNLHGGISGSIGHYPSSFPVMIYY